MIFLTCWLVLIICSNNSILVYGWGPVGHSLLVRLAQSQLVDSADHWVRSLTPWHAHGNLSTMASWADNIIYSDTNPTGYNNWQWSRPSHYINVPDWNCKYNPERDCINDRCVAGAIRNYTKRLETIYDETQQKEALYFLIHYMGDIHQPLHAGFASDRGGNSVRGYFMNATKQTNLHTLWDVDLLMRRLEQDFQNNVTSYYEHLSQIMLNQLSSNGNDSADENFNLEDIVQQSVDIVCSHIYFDDNNVTMNASVNFTLGEVYYQKSIPIIEQRLATGGRRLGVLLNRLAKSYARQPSDQKAKLCSGTIALIVILCVEGVLVILGGIFIWTRLKKKSYAISPGSAIPKV